MNFINYIIYCIALAFSCAFGGNTDGNVVDMLVGALCLLIPLLILSAITAVIVAVHKKKKKNEKDFLQGKQQVYGEGVQNIYKDLIQK